MTSSSTTGRRLAVLIAALALLAVSCSGTTAPSEKAEDGADDEVVLQGVDTVEIDPFTESVALAQYASFPADVTAAIDSALGGFQAAADAMRTIPGDTPGLYGGTGEDATCDMEALEGYMADPANADKADEFARVLGIETADIDETIGEYTTLVLSVDVFVTNHGFRDGRANPFGAVLQAGTAIAVDRHGIPRIKCGCGNPLAPAPVGVVLGPDTPTTGQAWDGYDPTRVADTEPSAEPFDEFEVIDPETGEMHRIPAGRSTPPSGDEDCYVDADGHGPDCDPDGDGDAPTTTDAPADPSTPPMGEDPSTMEDTPDPDDRSWGVTGGAANPDEDFRVECAPGGSFEPVYGSGPYELSSSVCTAAVHAGIITREGGGMVAVRQVDTGGPMDGSTANGVTTEPTGNPRGFFDFV